MTAVMLAVLGASVATGPATAATAANGPQSAVKVNQVGVRPGQRKRATVVSSSSEPLAWTLRNAAGTTVAQGSTVAKAMDAMSGDSAHTVDFSAYDTPGTGYVLSVAGSDSFPFDISTDPVKKLRSDALAFFYHQRSGTPIEAQYVGNQYARPAGHVGVAPNQGDKGVPCRSSCGYTLDVVGGWYDAGDHGKYVVNGGISTWELQSEYERAISVAGADAKALGDGTLAIPERSNGIPDVLDEARWEVEFLLSMQVPAGKTNAGMVHHKVTDEDWTGIPTRPEQDGKRRVLAPVSTAATLNMAAVAAQSARLWKTFDPAFSAKALSAAETAYSAAKAHPAMIATVNDSTGGGPYDDATVDDEFYWAAAELYTTTGSSTYRTDLTSSSLSKGASFAKGSMSWGWTAALGDITLALVKNDLPAADITATRSAITGYADTLLSEMATQAYPAPLGGTSVVWGSNGQVANNAIVLGVAYDLTESGTYKNGVFAALNYLQGRNPLGQSYIAGYGEQASHNMHHRFWAHQADASLPTPPAGSLAGGPNTGLEDPVAKSQLGGCKPLKCYVDDIGAYAVNEVAVNWNSALAWAAAWAAEKAEARIPAPAPTDTPPDASPPDPSGSASSTPDPSTPDPATPTDPPTPDPATPTDPPVPPGTTTPCRATVGTHVWPGGYLRNVTVLNGTSAADPWTVTFDVAPNVVIYAGWNATVSLSGTTVTATAPAWNRELASGEEVSIGYVASGTASPAPPTVTLNGQACTIGE